MARKDIHRPSAIVPADYDFVGFKYIGPNWGAVMDLVGDRLAIHNHMERTGGKYAGHNHGGTCGVCGASAFYLGVFHHRASNRYINVGETCVDKMEFSDEGFSLFRKNVRAVAENIAGKAKAQLTLAEMGLSAAYEIYSGAYSDKYEESTLRDMVANLVKYGNWSEKQEAFARTLLGKIENRDAIAAERAAADAKSVHVGTVGERRVFELECNWTTSFETAFGTLHVHGFKDAAGNVVIYKGKAIASRGEKVKLKATITEHGDRNSVKQTIINRPKLLEEAA